MGITNDLFPSEIAVGIDQTRMRLCDPIPDPEDVADPRTRRRGIDNFASFMRFLAPVARGQVDDVARTGETVFNSIGCASCHVPTDLLLHDVGTGDGIRQGAAAPEEIKTAALWGLRFRRPLLHDGSAATADEAVRRHAGEASSSRTNYARLSDEQRAALNRFLMSL
jgi:CxxC motif-containing protein (DUF1111 family)